VVPGFDGGVVLDSHCRWLLVSGFKLDWCEHVKRCVASLPVVPDLQVLEDRVAQLDAGAPALPVEELDRHASPGGLDHLVIEAIPDRAH